MTDPFDVVDLGTMAFNEGVEVQSKVHAEVQAGIRRDTLLLVEHPPVYTLGAAFQSAHLLLTRSEYASKGVPVVETSRGGDVTYHGPGQLVAYPIFHLDCVDRDVHCWLRTLEEAVILCLAEFGLSGVRSAPHTGVWVGNEKVAAIGVKVRRWVSMHGVALNCDNDLSPYDNIVPCGIPDRGMTSLSRLLGIPVSHGEARGPFVRGLRAALKQRRPDGT